MHPQFAPRKIDAMRLPMPLWAPEVTAVRLSHEDENEVLELLAERPIHTVAMAGFIRNNGLVSEYNRGTFYGCRNLEGKLEGVALIGHSILIEARSESALRVFAEIAKNATDTHMIMGEAERIAEFVRFYSDGGQQLRRLCREILFELRWPVQVHAEVPELRLGTPDDLDLIVPVHAQLSYTESGVDPLEQDALGFKQRCVRRLRQNRTFVAVENGKLMFKADIISETPDAVYVEGVWVNPEKRGQGYAKRCLSHVSRMLLGRTRSVCLLANIENERAHNFYLKAGFKMRGVYDSIFLKPAAFASPVIH
jgi:GNAT superfamily N-acetyltransferase